MNCSWAKLGYLVGNFYMPFNSGRLVVFYAVTIADNAICGVPHAGRRSESWKLNAVLMRCTSQICSNLMTYFNSPGTRNHSHPSQMTKRQNCRQKWPQSTHRTKAPRLNQPWCFVFPGSPPRDQTLRKRLVQSP